MQNKCRQPGIISVLHPVSQQKVCILAVCFTSADAMTRCGNHEFSSIASPVLFSLLVTHRHFLHHLFEAAFFPHKPIPYRRTTYQP
ncbi:hypothetical protein N431DRAFT_232341 [Stipitochalara longipes BDJ]|nr:hypothetical protein N431DRAFT_232341 [Stipitochalara longipes BDJ]